MQPFLVWCRTSWIVRRVLHARVCVSALAERRRPGREATREKVVHVYKVQTARVRPCGPIGADARLHPA